MAIFINFDAANIKFAASSIASIIQNLWRDSIVFLNLIKSNYSRLSFKNSIITLKPIIFLFVLKYAYDITLFIK